MRKDAAAERGANPKGGARLGQKDALEVRVDPGIDAAAHLPEDVGGHGAAKKLDPSTAARDEGASDLEDEDVVRGPADEELAGERDAGAPFVHPGGEELPGDEAAHQVAVRWFSRARRRVEVGRLPVEDGGREDTGKPGGNPTTGARAAATQAAPQASAAGAPTSGRGRQP